jgi:hypothetical protein
MNLTKYCVQTMQTGAEQSVLSRGADDSFIYREPQGGDSKLLYHTADTGVYRGGSFSYLGTARSPGLYHITLMYTN